MPIQTKTMLLIALTSALMNAWADNKPMSSKTVQPAKQKESINYCSNKDKAKEWEGMRLKYPADLGILHLYALRIGLCQSVDNKKMSLETAIDVFNIEHQKLFLERAQQKDPGRELAI